MQTFKRLLCLFLVLSLLMTSGIVEVLATDYHANQKEMKTVTQETDPLADLSEMFILEEPEQEDFPTETSEPVESAPVQTVSEESEPAVVAESQNFTYTVLDATTCRIDGYTGEIPAILEIPETLEDYTVVSIGAQAFARHNMQAVVLPDSVTAIDDYAFQNCSALETVTFGAGLNSIGFSAFEGCEKLTSVNLPDCVTKIGAGAFMNCVSLESFTYPAMLAESGNNYSYGIFSGCISLLSVEVPEGVTFIPANLFRNANYLQSVTLPSTLQTIGSNAFYGSGITSLTLPDSVTAIDNYAFQNCSALESVTFGAGLTSIGSSAFDGCGKLTSANLPDSVTKIGAGAFMNCVSLESFTYPAKLAETGNNYSYGIFSGCISLLSVEVPEGVTFIPANLFRNANYLQSVTLPSTLQTIGSNAFYGSSITALELPDSVTAIGDYAFQNCSALESVTFGAGLTSIGSSAFDGCGKLTSANLPDCVTKIGAGAFMNCVSLESFTYPAKLAETGNNYSYGIFSGCISLLSVEVPEGITFIPANLFRNANCLQSVALPSTLQTIGSNAFAGSGITSLTLPDSVTAIDNYAFQNCSALESVTFSAGLTSIGTSAFEGCAKLTSANLPDGVTKLGAGAFRNCTNLAEFTYPAMLADAGSGLSYGVFSGCSALVSVEIPEGVTVIPANLFRSATALKYVSVPSTLQRIGSQAFENSGILSIDLPDTVTTINDYAFQNCIALSSVNFGSGLTTIGICAFDGCSALTSIILPSSVTSVGTGAFRDCAALESVILSDNITKLTTGTFSGCSALRSIHLPRSLRSIQSNVFKNCVNLNQYYIPISVTSISGNAFDGISGLTFLCDLRSYAAQYAMDHQIPIIPTYIEEDADSTYLNTNTSYYIHNYDGLSASGVMSMVVNYELLEDAGVSPSAIIVNVYDYAALQENMITLDGKPCTDYDYDVETGRLTVPVENPSGTLRFCLKPLRYEALTSYARLQCTDSKGKSSVEVIGAVNSLMPALNISARAETSSSAVLVSGVAVPEAEISFYVDGSFVQTVKANKIGNYSTLVSLGKLEDGKEYSITAESFDRNGNPVQAQTGVTYRKSGVPELLDFTMSYNGNTYSLMNTHKVRPYVTFNTHGGRPFRFEVTFPPTDNLEEVYVVSTRNGIKKYMEALWDEDLGKYVAEGFFDPDNHNYIPGEITLEYTTEREKVSFDQTYDITSQEAYDELPDIWKNAHYEIINHTANDLTADIIVNYNEEDVTLRLEISNTSIPSYLTEHNAEQYGYTRVTDDYGKSVYVQKDQDRAQELADKYSSFKIMDFTTGSIQELGFSLVGGLVEVGTPMDVNDIMSALQSGMETYLDITYLEDVCAKNPNLTAEQKALFTKRAQQAKEFAVFSTTLKCSMVLMAAVIAPSGAVAIVGVALATFVVGKLCDLAMELMMCNLYSKAYGTKFKINWAIDPSGYVYDTYTGKRLSGVTVRAYWVENTEDDPAFWDAPPAEDEYGVLWDSTEYSQLNPLLTDNDGRYAWDVPEGWWRVSYEKEGYESTWSEWLPVPPPQTEVNIGMKPLYAVMRGDLDNNNSVDDEDVIYLLWHTLMPLEYPVNQDVDFDRNNSIDDEDVIYLLWHTLMPLEYPLQ